MHHDLVTRWRVITLVNTKGHRAMKPQLDRIIGEIKAMAASRNPKEAIGTVSLVTQLGTIDRDSAIPGYHLSLASALGRAFGCHVFTSKRAHDAKRGIYSHDIRVCGGISDAIAVSTLWDEAVRAITENHEATGKAFAGAIMSTARSLPGEQVQMLHEARERGAEYAKGGQ